MANTQVRIRSPKGSVGVTDVVDAGELSAYSMGVLSGFDATSAASWTLQIGGSSTVQDVAIGRNPAGESELFVGTSATTVPFIIGGAPGTPGQSRTDALVLYKDPFTTTVVNNGLDVTDYAVVPGTAATTGTQVPPSMATIRSTIPTGSLKFVAVIGYVTIAYGASGVVTGNYKVNQSLLDYRIRQDYQIAQIATYQSTSLEGPVDLATVGPTISLTIGASGKAHIEYCAQFIPTALGTAGRNFGILMLDVSGATTATSPYWNTALANETAWTNQTISNSILVSGLNPGITNFKLRYGAISSTLSFFNRQISGYAV